MTALKKYERLESLGLWREAASEQRREVIVSFGAASLVFSDINGKPLTHWSLAAISTLNAGTIPTVFGPEPDSEETLEIEDKAMIDAIFEVRRLIRKTSPKPGRMRWLFAVGLLSSLIVSGVLWLPSISVQYATGILPQAKIEQIGRDVLKQTSRLTGQPCSDPVSTLALERLEAWLLPGGGHIHVVNMQNRRSAHLPAGNILLDRSLIEENAGPEVAVGFVLMERVLARKSNPTTRLFMEIGILDTLKFIANGTFAEDDLATFAWTILEEPVVRPDDSEILQAFAEVKLTSAPFAYALDPSGVSTSTLIENNPLKTHSRPQLSDADWIALKSICDTG